MQWTLAVKIVAKKLKNDGSDSQVDLDPLISLRTEIWCKLSSLIQKKLLIQPLEYLRVERTF